MINTLNINRHWKRIINTMNDGLILIGPDGMIMMVNAAFEQLTGYAAEEVVGKPCTLLKCDACEKTLQCGGGLWCALFSRNHQDIKRCRCMIMKKDGSWLPAVKNASVLRDDDGAPLGVVETIMDIGELDRLEQKVESLSRQLDEKGAFQGIVGKSPMMQKVFDVVEKAARSDAPVIICGESGTGKELVAQAIHNLGPRKDGPFVHFNCAALNESLLESELFGHVKGAFTGAVRPQDRPFRGGRRRRHFSGRNRGRAVGHTGEASSGSGNQAVREGRGPSSHFGGRPRHNRHQQGPRGACIPAAFPGRSFFPHQRHSHPPSAPARPQG